MFRSIKQSLKGTVLKEKYPLQSLEMDIFIKSGETLVRHFDNITVAIMVMENGEPQELASGTCIKIGESYLIATAAHVLDSIDIAKLCLIPKGGCGPGATVGIIAKGAEGGKLSDPVDVAWLEISPKDVTRMRKTFIGIERLSPGVAHLEDDYILVSGYPRILSKPDVTKSIMTVQPIGCYTYTLPPGKWPSCAAGESFDVFLDYPQEVTIPMSGEILKVPDAPGLSGGGIWAANIRREGLWSPEFSHLIAIDISWHPDERWVRGTQVGHWIDLIRRDKPELRPALAMFP